MPKKSKGDGFYYLNHSMRIVKIVNVRFNKNGKISESTVSHNVEIKEIRMQVPLTCASSSKVSVTLDVVPNNNEEEQHNNEPMIENELNVEEPQEISLRRSQRERRLTISNDYVVYLHE